MLGEGHSCCSVEYVLFIPLSPLPLAYVDMFYKTQYDVVGGGDLVGPWGGTPTPAISHVMDGSSIKGNLFGTWEGGLRKG